MKRRRFLYLTWRPCGQVKEVKAKLFFEDSKNLIFCSFGKWIKNKFRRRYRHDRRLSGLIAVSVPSRIVGIWRRSNHRGIRRSAVPSSLGRQVEGLRLSSAVATYRRVSKQGILHLRRWYDDTKFLRLTHRWFI